MSTGASIVNLFHTERPPLSNYISNTLRRSTCPGETFSAQNLGHSFRRKCLILEYGRYPTFRITQCRLVEERLHAKPNSILSAVSTELRLVTSWYTLDDSFVLARSRVGNNTVYTIGCFHGTYMHNSADICAESGRVCNISTLWVKKQDIIVLSVTSPNVYRFSKFFYC